VRIASTLPVKHGSANPSADHPLILRTLQQDRAHGTMAAEFANGAEIPWGKYTYALEGLATGCYLEGGAADMPGKRRLRFRIELPSRCFVMSVSIRLSNGASLHDVTIERTLNNGDYELVHDGCNAPEPSATVDTDPGSDSDDKSNSDSASDEEDHGDTSSDDSSEEEEDLDGEEDGNDDLKDEGDADADKNEKALSVSKKTRLKIKVSKAAAAEAAVSADMKSAELKRQVVEIRRAADSLRLTMTDNDDSVAQVTSSRFARRASSGASANDDEQASGGMRVLAVSIIGYTRGQTPPSKALKGLLNVSAKLASVGTLADRAEIDGILGLTFLCNRRYRQAAELLRRAADLSTSVAEQDAKSGFTPATARKWAAQLNLLAAHAFFEHVPMSNDGVMALLSVSASCHTTKDGTSSFSVRSSIPSPRDIRDSFGNDCLCEQNCSPKSIPLCVRSCSFSANQRALPFGWHPRV
jgi:hypothetical protein